jgi:hypothetical protein
VEVPDLASLLGTGWSELDLSDVGEEFLLALLALHLPRSDAARAAAGWNGGRYRAWSDGARTAVVMATRWETLKDASEFAAAVNRWKQSLPAIVEPQGREVRVLFGSDATALQRLRLAAG